MKRWKSRQWNMQLVVRPHNRYIRKQYSQLPVGAQSGKAQKAPV